MLHPVIRVVSFFIFTAFAAYGQLVQLVAQAGLLLLFFLFEPQLIVRSRIIIVRMRWLFLSIFIVYLGFTPGLPLIPAWDWSPSVLGTQLAIMRVAALILIVMALQILLHGLSRQDLVGAVLWLLYPIRKLVDHEKLAVRIGLTLELVEQVALLNRLALKSQDIPSNAGLWQRINNISDNIATLFQTVLDKAMAMPGQTLETPDRNSPPPVQWIFPLLLLAGFILLDWEQWMLNFGVV
ncbi:MAG: hypothetical protein OEZ68_08840 [Gammaproteobacteria bacterium]|nr:hypothetical protein [Gammaproteobacteria bacterium]MDH5800893.1 hypothetical protein [Gammaproteobacteria bacterium]